MGAAQAAFGDSVKVSFVLFHGLTVELALSIAAISLGSALFIFRHLVRAWQDRLAPGLTLNRAYRWLLAALDRPRARGS